MRVKVEICVSTIEEARAAAALGVDGLEVCAWPTCGGTTPSAAMVLRTMSIDGPVVRVLIRATPGGFQHTDVSLAMMVEEAVAFRDLRAAHLVVGALDDRRLPDRHFIERIGEAHGTASLTFHRAIDHCPDQLEALEVCSSIGVSRILSSGGARTAIEGASVLARMVALSGSRTTVAAAGSIGPANVVEVVERTGVREVHFAAWRFSDAPALIPMSALRPDEDRAILPDEAKIEGVLNALVKAGLR